MAKEEWKQLGLGKHNLTIALDWMHDTFRDAPVLGSLINPASTDAAKIVQWEELAGALDQALSQEQNEHQHEATVVAQGLAKAASLLAGKYQWVVTNVPYLARGKQDERLRKFCERNYTTAKNDLATVFLDRCLEYLVEGGRSSIVMPQNWLFLTGYRKFREKLLKRETWHLIARLGEGGFDSSAAAGAFVTMISLSRGNPAQEAGGLFSNGAGGNLIRTLDVSKPRTGPEKSVSLLTTEFKSIEQKQQLENPDFSIELEGQDAMPRVAEYAFVRGGITTGDSAYFRRSFWEQAQLTQRFSFQQSTAKSVGDYSGRELCLLWDQGCGELQERAHNGGATIAGREAWNHRGIAITYTRSLRATIYLGNIFENVICVLIPHTEEDLPAIWCYCSSDAFVQSVRSVNQKMSVDVRYFEKAPIDIYKWRSVAKKRYPSGLPKQYTNDPTQWIFHGHPCASVIWDEGKNRTDHASLRTDDTVLNVSMARLLGYRWPAELDSEMELADEQREWVNRCEELLPFADEDGIVCIPPIRGEAAAADRLRNLLKAGYGDAWSASTERGLLAASSGNGKAASSLDQWLREQFFEQHCKLFQSRPFIWHLWDGHKDGFHALVNYHKLAGPDGQDRRTLEALTYSYLGEWIVRQRSDQQNEVEGSDARLAAALTLQGELEKILEGEPPYDIFVRWKPLHGQPLGWNPDINDGVRLNIRPFVLAKDLGRKGAGILRSIVDKTWTNAKKPGVKDRGKEVESMRPRDEFPWFWSCDPEKVSEHRTDFGAPAAQCRTGGQEIRRSALEQSALQPRCPRGRSRRQEQEELIDMANAAPATLLDVLTQQLRSCASTADAVERPAAILWTDPDGLWRSLVPLLLETLPELLVLGEYAPEQRAGPAVWLRCVIDGGLVIDGADEERIPIVYLPGIGRQDLRRGDDVLWALQPLVELQYRGALWLNKGQDWTVTAFLSSPQTLKLELLRDESTRLALLRALPELAVTPLSALKGRRLTADDFDRLLTSDTIRDLLRWMGEPELTKSRMGEETWSAFRSQARSQFGVDPQSDDVTVAGERLGRAEGAWEPVWQRFVEAPLVYKGIPELLSRSQPHELLLDGSRWPGINRDREQDARLELESLAELPHAQACDRVLELERKHGERRDWVWNALDQSPMARVLAPLAAVARICRQTPAAQSPDELATRYVDGLWQADRAAWEALVSTSVADEPVVHSALRALMEPWLHASACLLQDLVENQPLPLATEQEAVAVGPGECLVFVDGLRLDVGMALAERLRDKRLRGQCRSSLVGLALRHGHRQAGSDTGSRRNWRNAARRRLRAVLR